MRSAAKLGSEVMTEVINLIRPGVTELDLAAEIDYRMRRKGAAGPSFETIVASGPRTALPHAHPTAKALQKNELVALGPGCYTPPLLQRFDAHGIFGARAREGSAVVSGR